MEYLDDFICGPMVEESELFEEFEAFQLLMKEEVKYLTLNENCGIINM